jgi:DNA-binding NarL/FixJ family response regulator
MSIRILIADDHPIVRSGVKTELISQRDFEVVGEASQGDECIEMALRLRPDVLLLDIRMPGTASRDIIKRIRSQKLPIRIIILSAYNDEGTVSSIMRLGVDGYLLKDEDPSVLPEAIRSVMRGKKMLSSSITSLLLDQVQGKGYPSEEPELTGPEIAVVRLLALGRTSKEIAAQLEVKQRTVEFRIRRIYKMLGVNSRPPVVLWAKERGLL